MNHKLCFIEVTEMADQIHDLQSDIKDLQTDLINSAEENERLTRRIHELEKALDEIEYIRTSAR